MEATMGKYGSLHAFTEAARGNVRSPSQTTSATPEMSSPAQQTSRLFAYQSYFDGSLLENAILVQNKNSPIVESTVKEEQIAGYSLGLHPSSQTPVAVQFLAGGQPSTSQAITMKPGQIIRPHGVGRNGAPGHFSGFRWGLPFGWLGGGMAHLIVNPSPDADVLWPGNQEVVFHRTRLHIFQRNALPAAAPKNWPTRFPWTQAAQGSVPLDQSGSANIAVTPTKTLIRLFNTNPIVLAAAANMRFLVQGSNEFSLNSAGALILTPTLSVPYTWGIFAASAGASYRL